MVVDMDFAFQACDDLLGKVLLIERLSCTESAGGEDVDFHEFVTDDIEAYQEHTVGDELWAHNIDHLQHLAGDLNGHRFSAQIIDELRDLLLIVVENALLGEKP